MWVSVWVAEVNVETADVSVTGGKQPVSEQWPWLYLYKVTWARLAMSVLLSLLQPEEGRIVPYCYVFRTLYKAQDIAWLKIRSPQCEMSVKDSCPISDDFPLHPCSMQDNPSWMNVPKHFDDMKTELYCLGLLLTSCHEVIASLSVFRTWIFNSFKLFMCLFS